MSASAAQSLQVTVKENPVFSSHLLEAILAAPQVRAYLKGIRFRVLDTQFFDPDEKESRQFKYPSSFSNFYQVIIYNYTRNRAVHITANSLKKLSLELTESSYQPEPNDEEFQEAVNILLSQDERLKNGLAQKTVRLYRPMPPTINVVLPSGIIERTLTVGVQSRMSSLRSEILGVNMITERVVHLENLIPRGAMGDNHCGSTDAHQGTTAKGTAGQSWVSVTQGGTEIWKFMVVRPSASSGTKGSGIELKFVDYRGKRVLYQAHVPILNVRYENDACGPYRDWQYAEGMFQANGNDPAPGIRVCATPATTILDTGNDSGNFKGVAIYVQDQEVVLVSELEAGWYRYISEWRLHVDGTIRPRFGFAAVQSSCVCNKHHHHVYWRLDFDVGTPGNNLVEEFNDPILVGNSHWHKKTFEIRRLKDASRKRKWKISNTQTGQAYEIIPGDTDGVADDFGVGDLWVLRYKGGSEIDDGATVVSGTPDQCKAHIDNFLTGELVENQDVVIWYGAHFTHDVSVETGHIVGPTLKPVTG